MIKYYTELNFFLNEQSLKDFNFSLFSSSQINPPRPCVVSGGELLLSGNIDILHILHKLCR